MDHEIKSYILNHPFHIGVYVSQVEEYIYIHFMKIYISSEAYLADLPIYC